jgi:hypothetical protein
MILMKDENEGYDAGVGLAHLDTSGRASVNGRNGHARNGLLNGYPTSGSRSKREEDEEGEEQEVKEDAEMVASWAGQPNIKGSTETMRMALLTLSLVGLQ